MLVVRDTVVSGTVTIGSDKVAAWAPIPPGGKLLSVTGELHVVADEETPVAQFRGYGISAELVPLTDPDGSITLDVLWDQNVSKTSAAVVAAGSSEIDFDWDTSDSGPDVEPGEMDMNAVTGLLSPGKTMMDPHMEWMSFAKGPGRGFLRVDAASDHYVPTSYKTFRMARTLAADKIPHYAMIALSAPNFDNEEVAHSTINTAQGWGILSNLDNIMDDFWRINAGMIEAGAESPYAEISAQVEDLVAPEIVMPATATITQMTSMTFLMTCRWLLDLPDESFPGVLKAN